MKKFLIIATLFVSVSAQARRCPVTCQYTSKMGVPVAGCAQDKGSAWGKLFKNCLESANEVFDEIDFSGMDGVTKANIQLKVAEMRTNLCLADTDGFSIYCQDNALEDAERAMKLDMYCHVTRLVSFAGIPLYYSREGCHKYAPKY
ncbi:MAG: hypothetical protein A4S09_03575 [Proteobacteria bacterium SG_bin7]|nr:MAG: hypothetical protein A4S09_03575 [Proteobacteria bacterium SG_bin7]